MRQKTNNQHWKVLVLFLNEVRKDKGISQEELAVKLNMKQSAVSRIFKLHHLPSLERYLQIAVALEVNFFFDLKDSNSDANVLFEKAMTDLGRRADKLNSN